MTPFGFTVALGATPTLYAAQILAVNPRIAYPAQLHARKKQPEEHDDRYMPMRNLMDRITRRTLHGLSPNI